MSELRQTAESIHAQFSDRVDASVDDIENRLETLVSEYKVPLDEEFGPDCFDADHRDCRGCREDVRDGRVETW